LNKLALTLVAAFASTSASAADLAPRPYVKAPVAERVVNWTGFYVGGQVGGAWADRTTSFTGDAASAFIFNPGIPVAAPFPGQIAPAPHNFPMSGVTGGVEAGYNWQLGQKWLAGVEADFSGSNLRGAGSETTPFAPPGLHSDGCGRTEN
jgi:outer membrane immunogenic protein